MEDKFLLEAVEDSRIYDEVQRYLTDGTYPEGAEKPDKAVIRKRSKKFEVVDGCLMYKDKRQGRDILRQVSHFHHPHLKWW